MSETQTSGGREQSWHQLSEALANLSATWRVVAASQADSRREDAPATHQLARGEADELARAGYEAAEALAGIATVLAGQKGAGRAWESAQESQRDTWRRWRVAMDAQVPDEDTPP